MVQLLPYYFEKAFIMEFIYNNYRDVDKDKILIKPYYVILVWKIEYKI